RTQQYNAQLIAGSALSTAASIPLTILNSQDILASVATGGIGLWGTTATSLGRGVLANTIKGGAAAAMGTAAGGGIDVKWNEGFTAEDIVWGTLINTPLGMMHGRAFGRVFESAPTNPTGAR